MISFGKFPILSYSKILTVLGATQRRSTPLLRALSYHLNKSSDKFSIHLSTDILFALHRLSFHDQVLIERICDDVVTQLNSEVKSSLVGSLLTSLGQLKYRHEGFVLFLFIISFSVISFKFFLQVVWTLSVIGLTIIGPTFVIRTSSLLLCVSQL